MTFNEEQIRSLPWHKYGQPEFNHRTTVPDAIVAMWQADDNPQACAEACKELLNAVANEHSGVYYPVLIEVLPYIEEMLLTGSAWQKHVLIVLLHDLSTGLECEGLYEPDLFSEGKIHTIDGVFKRKLLELRPLMEQIAATDEFNAENAKYFIEQLDDIALELSENNLE
jgi:hypothetical protein